jgi:hypothetical protein
MKRKICLKSEKINDLSSQEFKMMCLKQRFAPHGNIFQEES